MKLFGIDEVEDY